MIHPLLLPEVPAAPCYTRLNLPLKRSCKKLNHLAPRPVKLSGSAFTQAVGTALLYMLLLVKIYYEKLFPI